MGLRMRLVSLVLAMVIVIVAGCSSSDEAVTRGALADGCSINSDCASPLVCAFRRCHTACESSRDCPTGQNCMASDKPFHVCQLPEETTCGYNSECPSGQLCGVDGRCRDQCRSDRDCVSGQVCAQGTCAEPDELQDGGLPHALDASAEAAGQPCSYSSQCASPLVCRQGLCVVECLADVDCPLGASCASGRCVAVPTDAGTLPPPDAADGSVPPCQYNSECDEPLVCRNGTCAYECLGDVDCAVGLVCTSHRCAAPVVDASVTDASPDVSTDASPDVLTDACVPTTCVAASKNCGLIQDGCGGTLDCGGCPSGQACGAGGIANVCAIGSCHPKSCEAQGKNCGTVSDGCSWLVQCGACMAPETCGGGGAPNVCGCTPDVAAACAGKGCGTALTNCGTTVSCGTCTAPNTCGGAGTPNQCGCAKTTCGAQGKDCGQVLDGCGGLLDCGSCATGVCGGGAADGGAGTPNVCGPGSCTATTCSALGKDCGSVSDGCGAYADCGSCSAPDTCGGGGTANVCGCTKTTCAAAGKNCGTIADGCGGVLDCGACAAPSTCGGSGTANVCGCTKTTCAAAGKNCGTIADGCGGLLTCGMCSSPEVCGGGGVPNVCAVSVKPPSCLGGGVGAGDTCGSSNDDCCASLLAPAGSFDRSNDTNYPGSVHAFRLDRYLVTVGRFRAYLQEGGPTKANPPVAWSGAHPYVANSGWNPTWNGALPSSVAELTSRLRDGNACWNGPDKGTWTSTPAGSDNDPMVCATWYEAMAFCAWDGGWLVTEVQLNYAQVGGDEQRVFPWSVPPASTTIDASYATYGPSPNHPVSVGSKSPKGDGRWGHTDLIGNVSEWLMDVWSSPYQYTACADCAYLGTASTERVIRGGSWYDLAASAGWRDHRAPTFRDARVGFRCARLP